MLYFDAHNHLCNSHYPKFEKTDEYFCISSFCQEKEWKEFLHHDKKNILKSFGIHPQMFATYNFCESDYEKEIDFLKMLLDSDSIFAIGEIGFDFFNEEFKLTKNLQEKYWNKQIDLAIEYNKPIVIHCRKAIDMMFADINRLKKLPFVIFHSFAGTKNEAKSILNKKINAFFSFGKHQIFNEKKASIEMLKSYEDFENRILLETDCPYQTLKNEVETESEEIKSVYKKVLELLNVDFCEIAQKSFEKMKLFIDF